MEVISNRPAARSDGRERAGRRALVVRIGALGDVVLTRRLSFSLWRAGFRTTLFAPSRHASVLLGDPWVDAVLDSESPRFAPAFNGSWPDESRFDVAILISNSESLEKAVGGASGVVIRVSPGSASDDTLISRQWTSRASGIAPPAEDALPVLPAPASDALVSGATLIHPGSGSAEKNWAVERFAELGGRLEALGHRLVWILGPAEAGLASSLSDRIIDRPSLSTLAATLARCRLYIGNDSGVSHLAGALGAPTLVLFGPTNSAVWRPDGPRVDVLQAVGGALQNLPVEAVVTAAVNLADSGSREE